MVLTTLLVCNINAQNTDVEIAMQETKTEVFLKNCSFVRSDQIAFPRREEMPGAGQRRRVQYRGGGFDGTGGQCGHHFPLR